MALTDRAILNLKTTGKVHKHFDGGGLHIHVSPTGGKLWRMAYRYNGKSKLLSFGAYLAVTLEMARDRPDEAICCQICLADQPSRMASTMSALWARKLTRWRFLPPLSACFALSLSVSFALVQLNR